MFTIISWYTKQTEYDSIMRNYLIPSLQKLNIPYKIYPVDSIGNWQQNTNLKPLVIETAFQDLDTDLLIVDADAKIYQYPKLLEEIPEEYDMAIFYLDWDEWYHNGSKQKELCSGTLYIRNKPICQALIRWWIKICSSHNLTDQKALKKALLAFPNIKIYKLPYEYCWINSLPSGDKPFVERPKEVVVEHFQVSRKIKRRI